MMDTSQARLELAREGMELSVAFLFIRLKLKRVSIEEHNDLNRRADRYQQLLAEVDSARRNRSN
jgi:hypothetical protein